MPCGKRWPSTKRRFSETSPLERAKKARQSSVDQLQRWWCAKYTLPPNHELLLARTVTSLAQERFADLLDEQEALEKVLATANGPQVAEIRQRLETLAEVLGASAAGGDDLSDFWDAEIAAGRTPDLDMTLDDLRELKRSGAWLPKK